MYQGRQNSLAADSTAPISAALYDCSVVTAPADYAESVQHSLQETWQAVADTDAGMHSIHVAQVRLLLGCPALDSSSFMMVVLA